MLEKLDSIDWSELSHAYGEASDVPDLIRDLVSDDEETRKDAISELFGNIVHQGTIYEATSQAVPFLIELLEADSISGKDDILALLSAIREGTSYFDVRQDDDWFFAERESEDFAARLKHELDDVRRSHDAVGAGTPVYFSLLSEASAEVRMWALYTLSKCVERAEAVETGLWVWYGAETDAQVKASMMLCLRDLWQQRASSSSEPIEPSQIQCHRVLDVMRAQHESALVRLSAALTLLGWLEEETCDEALSLVERLVDAGWQGFSSLPWSIQISCPSEAMTSGFKHRPELKLRFLLDLLRNPNHEVRKDAIFELGNLCRERRAPSLQAAPALGELLSDADAEVRGWAASTLVEIGSAASLAIEPLLVALDDANAGVRGNAAIALAKVREERAIPRIRELLRDADTSAEALKALKRFGPKASNAIPHLHVLLQQPTSGLWAVDILLALAEIDQTGEASLANVAAMLRGPFAGTAAWVLSTWGSTAQPAMPELIATLDSQVARDNAVRALGNIGAPAACTVPRLVQMLEMGDPLLRTCAAIALWQIERSELTVPALIGVIEQEFDSREENLHYECSVAVEYLGEIGVGASSVAAILRRALRHESGGIRVSAACSLWRITGSADEALPVLIRGLKSPYGEMEIIECLAAMGTAATQAIPDLRRIAESEERFVQSGISDELIDQDEAIQKAARQALKDILSL